MAQNTLRGYKIRLYNGHISFYSKNNINYIIYLFTSFLASLTNKETTDTISLNFLNSKLVKCEEK